ncbi:hypothetical protein EVAR_46769_1 [Eumeta japonica]|uniref:Uncharacterized protein n=1 Tax=Eumeta variegata TaxID=151549 RepID=A0A4C2AAC6_EUMVA|nr:hypothetical protein EVAR_46769_1 [Eumeta japonica]
MCKLITIKCDESEAGCAGSDLSWPRGKRRARAHGKAAALARCAMQRPATVSPPSTADEETLSLLRVLKRSSGPPSARQSAIQRKKVRSPTPGWCRSAGRISLHGPSPYSESRRARRAHTDEWRVTIDHSASERVPTTSPVPPARACHVPRPYRRAQPKPAEPPHLRMEYEAAEELAAIQKQDAEIRRELVKKRLAMNLAEIEAATECDEAEEHAVHRTEDSARRVEAWIESTPPVVNVINAAANQAGIPRREGVADRECNRAQWRDVNIAVKGAGPSRARRCYKQTGETAADTAPSL